MSEQDRPAATSTDDLCDHGCGLDATVQHADGRFLCYPCYRVEVEDADIQWRVSGSCPTCSPKPSDAALVRPLAGSIVLELGIERHRQDEKWGGVPGVERRDDHTYAAVLGEEFGECCRAWLERDVAALRVELIQTAAVAIAWVEEIDNGGGLTRV